MSKYKILIGQTICTYSKTLTFCNHPFSWTTKIMGSTKSEYRHFARLEEAAENDNGAHLTNDNNV